MNKQKEAGPSWTDFFFIPFMYPFIKCYCALSFTSRIAERSNVSLGPFAS